jgi:thymidylate synthase (FAD)
MTASLQWITPDAQAMIVHCARVSSDPEVASQPDEKLLRYLIRHKHFSPFEMSSACLEIRNTRDIARQILRHRSFSFQEFSQRYQDVSVLGDPILRECRMQHPTNRQMSLPCEDAELAASWQNAQATIYDQAMAVYADALAKGIAKEVARAILPEGLTPSRMFMSGTIRSWVHFIAVRTDETAQAEVRQIAAQCRDILRAEMPVIFDAMEAVQ